MHRQLAFVALLGVVEVTGGCNEPPQLIALGDQVAYVNSELTLTLQAVDPDGDELTFGFTADIADIASRAHIQPSAAPSAVFHYTPIASDVGIHAFDFTVTDGTDTVRETISIDIRAPTGEDAPIFREPVGTGTTLDLSQQQCSALDIVVEDPDSPEVLIEQLEPLIGGATLTQTGPLAASWQWCPSQEQIDTDDRYRLRLSARDPEQHQTTKDFLVVLRKAVKTDCPGSPPAIINHTPATDATLLPVLIEASVQDDQGIKNEPLLYYATTPPGTPPDLGRMTQLGMLLLDGDTRDGYWAAEVPNPVVGGGAGASADLYYVIVAEDNDDPTGDCDHLAQSPPEGSHRITVTNPGGQGGLELCRSCTADVQCGGAGDNCIRLGTSGDSFCGRACAADADCPLPEYYCSITELTSVDGVKARQCIPQDYACGPGPCADDGYEDNDSLNQAMNLAPLAPGSYTELKICPAGAGTDEDWYPIIINAETEVTVSLSGGTATDLDLALVASMGTVVAKSDRLGSEESLSACVAPGKYFIRVFSWASGENAYSVTFGATARSCQSVCEDDSYEDDDDAAQARYVDDYGQFISQTNAICPWDDDWYEVYLVQGETIHATLAFTQTNAKEDLDLRFFQDTGSGGLVSLTRCDELDVSGCSSANGQSTNSNENFAYTVAATATYYVVVHGWDGAANLYDICISITEMGCPPL